MKKIILFLLMINQPLKAQISNFGVELGYKYRYTNNAIFGLSYKLEENHYGTLRLPDWTNLNIAYITDFNDEHYVVAGITKTFILLEIGLYASTQKDIEPILGFNLGNIARINFGYNIAFKQKNNFTFGVSFALGRSKYYIAGF